MKDLAERLHELLEQAVMDSQIAGANLLVYGHGGELAYTEAGYADTASRKAYRRDTIARIYSMTKPITAAAAMVLMERGQLDLGQNVAEILSAFRQLQVWEHGKKVPARRNLLIKDLLNMTSGLAYPGEDESGKEVASVFEEIDQRLYSNKPLDTLEITQRLEKCGLAFHPGQQWMYGSSADVLGAVIEQVSGLRFGDFLHWELFEPLGMADTDFYVPPEKQHRLAEVYERSEQGMKRCVTNNLGIRYTQDVPPAFESGGAGLVSTIDDYAKFARMLLNHGKHEGQQILKPETVRYMTTGKLLPWQQESLWRSWDSMAGYGYGNLMRVMEEPGMALCNTWKGEYGWDGWLGTYFCNSPENGVTILLFCQRKDAGTMELTRKIRNVIAANL